jgi:hypothetical protein
LLGGHPRRFASGPLPIQFVLDLRVDNSTLLDLGQTSHLLFGALPQVLEVFFCGRCIGLTSLEFSLCVRDLAHQGIEFVEVDRCAAASDRSEMLRRQRLIRIGEIDEQRHCCGPAVDEAARSQGLKLGAHLGGPLVRCCEVRLLAFDLDGELVHRRLSVEHRLRRFVRAISRSLDLLGGLLSLCAAVRRIRPGRRHCDGDECDHRGEDPTFPAHKPLRL